jgi:hypothetical protein
MEYEFPRCSNDIISSLTYIERGGGTVLLHAGHQYTLKEKYKNGTMAWECIHRKRKRCGGKITLKVSTHSSYNVVLTYL